MTAYREQGAPAQMNGNPVRAYYTGGDPALAVDIDDLRARAHRRMPRFVLEYLEGGAGQEATLSREREVYGEWLFMPHTLMDEAHRDLTRPIFGRSAKMPLLVGPTGLNGLFMRGADTALARACARFGVPFVQSTMSNERMEDIARVEGLRHWWQLYVFGPDEIWQSLVDRAAACGCEALVVTTNSQIYGERQWSTRTRSESTLPSFGTLLDVILHPGWLTATLNHGMPEFANVVDHIPAEQRAFFDSAYWIRGQMPAALSWRDIARIRDRWKGPMFVKGILNLDDLQPAIDSGVDGVMMGSHGGRQADTAVSALDLLLVAREIIGDRIALYVSGGIRHGTDCLKALALGADAVIAGRAPLYGLCAGGEDGVVRALEILHDEALNEMAQMGVPSLAHLNRDILVRRDRLPLRPS
jgi:(S)-mandelate dehydrogenase